MWRHELANDRWAVEHVYRGMRDGYFIEAGATNGVNGSATFVLEKEYGWTGLLVEPIPPQFAHLKKVRSARADDRCLWSTTGDTVSFSYFPQRSGRSGITDVNKNLVGLRREDSAEQIISKPTITLEDLLREHAAPPLIHYLCLDVEGAERAILGTFPFGREHTLLAVSIEGKKCDDVMAAAGYVRTRNPFNQHADFERYFLHPRIVDVAPHLAEELERAAAAQA